MSTVAVSDIFEDKRTVAVDRVLFAVLDGSFDGEDVHSVDLETGDVLSTLVVFGQSGGAVGGCAHTVFVVCCGRVSILVLLKTQLEIRRSSYSRSRIV